MAVRTYQAGEIVFKQGDWGKTMYEIKSGRVGVYTDYQTGAEKLLTELKTGDIFGELALIEIRPRSATVVALDELCADEIDSETLNTWVREDPVRVRKIMTSISHRIRALTEDYEEANAALREVEEALSEFDTKRDGLFSKFKKFLHVAEEEDSEFLDYDIDTLAPRGDDEKGISPTNTYNAGHVLFAEGDLESCMYYLGYGTIGVYLNYGKPEEKLIRKIPEGSYFGEMGLLEHLPRTLTAVILEDGSEIEVIYEKDLDTLLTRCPAKSFMILQYLSSRLHDLTDDYVRACRRMKELLEEQ